MHHRAASAGGAYACLLEVGGQQLRARQACCEALARDAAVGRPASAPPPLGFLEPPRVQGYEATEINRFYSKDQRRQILEDHCKEYSYVVDD